MLEFLIEVIGHLTGRSVEEGPISPDAYSDSALFLINIAVSLLASIIAGGIVWLLVTRHQNRSLELSRGIERLSLLNELDIAMDSLNNHKGVVFIPQGDSDNSDAGHKRSKIEFFFWNNVDIDGHYKTRMVRIEDSIYQRCIPARQDLPGESFEVYVERDLLEKVKFMFFKYARGIQSGFIGGEDLAAIHPPLQNFTFKKFFAFFLSVLYDMDGLEGHSQTDLITNADYRIDVFITVFACLVLHHSRAGNYFTIEMIAKQAHQVVIRRIVERLRSKGWRKLAINPDERDKVVPSLRSEISIRRARRRVLDSLDKELHKRKIKSAEIRY